MTLAQRLLVAIAVLTVATTLALGFGVREALRNAEEQRFQAQFESAIKRLELELGQEVQDLPRLLSPLCDHDPVLDSALVDLKSGDLDPGARLSLSLRVPELAKSLRLDELLLVTGRGEILGTSPESGRAGARDPKLGEELRADPRRAVVREGQGPVAVVAHCSRSNGAFTIGLVGARRLESILVGVSASQGLSLSLDAPHDASDLMVRTVELPALSGVRISATRSVAPLRDTLFRLDETVFFIGVATFAAALVFATILSRSLARPIVSLSEQARKVVGGEPVPVEAHGGREVEEFARVFNQTISDLARLRKRLAATERIAARREIARRVAHEIKNPLAPIRAAVETLRRLRARSDPAFDEYFDEATRTVLDEVSRIANIVQEFTRFARLPPPNPALVDLEQVVRDVARLHAASGVPIDVSVSGVGEVRADRDQVVQVLTNLLQNATDAVSGLPSPRVTLELAELADPSGAPRKVRLAVRDNGPGVTPDMRERLFEPYATSKEHGTGLGLAIVERIVVEHGGEIAYRDAPGGGAEFTVILPSAGPALLTDAPPPSSDRTG